MGPITAVTLNGSGHGVVVLALTLGLLVLNFFAVTKVITKAGYSYRWIYVPLTPVVLWCASVILLAVDVRTAVVDGTTASVPASLGNFFILEALDFVSLFVTWVFFLIFAFSTWPVSTGRGGPPVPPPGAPGSPFPHRRSRAGARRCAGRRRRWPGTGTGTLMHPPPRRPRRLSSRHRAAGPVRPRHNPRAHPRSSTAVGAGSRGPATPRPSITAAPWSGPPPSAWVAARRSKGVRRDVPRAVRPATQLSR